MWPRILWQSGAGLVRHFAILSLIVIGLITAALSFVLSHYLRKDLLEREWRITADFVHTEALQQLTPGHFADPFTREAQDDFQTFYRQAVMMPEIVRVKIYDAAMTVVWSDEQRLIGQRFPDNPQLREAVAGRTVVNVETGDRKGENIYEGEEFPQLVEVYVPIVFPGTTRVAGVVETYKAPRMVFANIHKGRITVVTTSLVGGVLLYLSLFWIVRRAARRIAQQHQALERGTSDLEAANQELRAVQTQLISAERMAAIGEVVTAVAHGIRNPLANIRAAAQVAMLDCQQCWTTTRGPKNLTNIISEVDRLEGRVKELLQFVRPTERQSTPVDLNGVMRGALETMAERIASGRLEVDQQFAPAVPPIMGDAMLAEQIFMNLIGNAIEAMPDGGRIVLTTGMKPGNGGPLQVFAEVRDTGPGVPAEDLPYIFDLFYTTKAQGTGVGLALAKKFTEAHGGSIAVTSRPGEGTTFVVTFPAPAEG